MEKSGVEPHITVKAQGGLSHDLAWFERVREVCKWVKPFRVVMGNRHVSGNRSILYVSGQSAGSLALAEAGYA